MMDSRLVSGSIANYCSPTGFHLGNCLRCVCVSLLMCRRDYSIKVRKTGRVSANSRALLCARSSPPQPDGNNTLPTPAVNSSYLNSWTFTLLSGKQIGSSLGIVHIGLRSFESIMSCVHNRCAISCQSWLLVLNFNCICILECILLRNNWNSPRSLLWQPQERSKCSFLWSSESWYAEIISWPNNVPFA